MSRDEEDRLFAEEMAQSTLLFKHAARQGFFDAYRTVQQESKLARARSRSLSAASALLRELSRRVRAESAAEREDCEKTNPQSGSLRATDGMPGDV
jgi:hypothetical protein